MYFVSTRSGSVKKKSKCLCHLCFVSLSSTTFIICLCSGAPLPWLNYSSTVIQPSISPPPFFTCRHATCSHMWLHWETRYLWQHEPTTITGSYLALGAFLGVSLTVLDDTRPGSEQLVSFSILPTFQPVMPWGVAFKAPHELAIATLDLQDGKKSICSFYSNVRGEMWICGDALISPCTCAQSGWSRAPSEW